jgi:cytochrome b561
VAWPVRPRDVTAMTAAAMNVVLYSTLLALLIASLIGLAILTTNVIPIRRLIILPVPAGAVNQRSDPASTARRANPPTSELRASSPKSHI